MENVVSPDSNIIRKAAAQQLTDAIKDGTRILWDLISEAYTTRAWSVLGYSSWDDYCIREFGTSRFRLPREERQEVVSSLREQGLSLRAIESATGLGKSTVQRHLAPVPDGTPVHHEVLTQEDCERIEEQRSAVNTPEQMVEPAAKVVGTDGKTYSAVQPSKARRRPLPDAYRDAFSQLRRAVETLERLHQDDRFQGNRKSIAEFAPGGATSDLSFRLTSIWRHLYGTDRELGVYRERGKADIH